MWICINHVIAAPIMRDATAAGNAARAETAACLEEPDEEDERRRQDVRRVDEVCRELDRPRDRQQPSPYQPLRRRGRRAAMYDANAASAANDSSVRAARRATRDTARCAAARRRAAAAARPGSRSSSRRRRAEVRPVAGGVIAQPHQEDLRFVLEEELARKAETETEEKEQGEEWGATDRGVRGASSGPTYYPVIAS